jgi:hypothetical protein
VSYYKNAVIKANLIKTAIGYLPDEEAETVTALFPDWEVGRAYAIGDRVKYNELLYRCGQAHTSQADWTPDATPALWTRTSTEEWPEWVQPTGASDAYNTGDKVTYNGEHYISLIDNNVWPPDTYPAGWEKQ